MFAYLEKSSRKNDHTRNESFDKLFLTVRQEKYAQYIRGIRHVVLRFAELSGTCNTTRWRRPRNLTRLTTNLRAYFEPLPRFSNFPISFKISTVLHTQKKERKLRIKRFKNEWNSFFEQSQRGIFEIKRNENYLKIWIIPVKSQIFNEEEASGQYIFGRCRKSRRENEKVAVDPRRHLSFK